ncbi:uncharacterized protein CLUP02_07032 [Colletotrichum lupini]|uniref:Uncharacterized protein n=1 Tax=Colletotrichum lupini TaxID=145971 RepID=A0A9Q8WFP3_9PEZI|nr:uncharacterized protein CLUP02_07032 [Colletotrichum lupini]UQC81546.1 hypothetical protein CLUP02_07032 [Colletotrichum lupini]
MIRYQFQVGDSPRLVGASKETIEGSLQAR